MISASTEKCLNRRKQRKQRKLRGSRAFIALFPLFSSVGFLLSSSPLQAEEFRLRDGDRVVLIGSTLIEREQESGYWETALTSRFPKSNVTFRNLGWSGDTVFCDARAMFESPAVGLQHLKEDLARLKPTVILVGYGMNESFEGESGLLNFQKGLASLLDMLASTKARIVLISPPPQEKSGSRLPDPTKHNQDIKLYSETLRSEAQKRGFFFLDLFTQLLAEAQTPTYRPLTDNGIHFTDFGYWRTSQLLEQMLVGSARSWRVDMDKDGTTNKVRGASRLFNIRSDPVRFEALDKELPIPVPPLQAGTKKTPYPDNARVFRVARLHWKYSLQIDGREVATASNEEWDKGVPLIGGPEFDQVEKLRQTIIEKNRFFFHGWRPQNETYIYGFRKHEQGQNAREIPEFDPLIVQLEKKIAQLRVPLPHQYELTSNDQ
ncbi:MAG TPA: SGNH/GDSL hydrolase family protein [Gemmataceae bacterium]|nr:SGNH/GDSL hydrolase family protein [Gemmataceae bacterium]